MSNENNSDVETSSSAGRVDKKVAETGNSFLDFVKDADPEMLERFMPAETHRRESPKVGRNDPCTCGSGRKYKKCCG